MSKFAVGDRVRCTCSVGWTDIRDAVGTILETDGDVFGIAFDDNINGHDLNGKCENRHGWWVTGDIYLERHYDELPAFQAADHSAILSLIGG